MKKGGGSNVRQWVTVSKNGNGTITFTGDNQKKYFKLEYIYLLLYLFILRSAKNIAYARTYGNSQFIYSNNSGW